jgi:hypothetical protein
MEAALDILEKHMPEYAELVRKGVIPLEEGPKVGVSGGIALPDKIVVTTDPDYPLSTAATLYEEIYHAHQEAGHSWDVETEAKVSMAEWVQNVQQETGLEYNPRWNASGDILSFEQGGPQRLRQWVEQNYKSEQYGPGMLRRGGADDVSGGQPARRSVGSGRWTRTTTPWQRRVYQRSDIDWNLVRPEGVERAGLTNRRAAEQGYAPVRIDPDTGKVDLVTLHHANQDPRGAVVELWRTTHGRVPHKMDPPGNWREARPDWASAWNDEQSAYWRWRTGVYNPTPTNRLLLPGDE